MRKVDREHGRYYQQLHWKGLATTILAMCSHYYDRNGEIKDMDENKRGAFKHIVEGMQSDHLRTVSFAYKAIGVSILQDNDLILVGILGLKSTCCTERTDAISACQNAGVKIILASEDDISVLENVAHKCGLMLPNSDRLQGECLKKKGNVVAVVGTRTTSSAALQEADVGVAMGFGAVKCNILKYIQLELTMIISGTLITFITTVSLVDVPITAIQLILANFIVNLVGGFALLSEPPTDELMNNPPISPTETFIPKSM
ncbi:calcium-transporting ATPase 12, plasma membrane-type-like [Ziziphus jujuba]|uniref:Calcium-transporting ATPase 12, plasma membrane-type-like n=1 Tax=Ziziphus jujuba TaxID=326968 RepID=A0ABM4ACJ2_ZIZJJ|nr:calcium-transporting ATPase 12, plasma membrane-type-like [Ziziphus jujuba]